ncbi:MAG: hypothetical protein AB8B50_12040 [Pirellulaceae bacterium]
MKRPTQFALTVLFSIALFSCGCTKSDVGESVTPTPAPEGAIDPDGEFEAMLVEIDAIAGKRMTHGLTGASVSATYKLSGAADGVIPIVDAYAANAGFKAAPADALENASQAMPAGAEIKDSRIYSHANGDMLTMMQMEMSMLGTSSEMLSIKLISPSRVKQP